MAANDNAHSDGPSPASNPDGLTGRLAAWIHSLQLTDVPADVVTRAKYLILDGVACALVGAKLPWSTTAAQAFIAIEGGDGSNGSRKSGSDGKCGVIGWGTDTRLSPLTAVVLNSAFIQGFELDDFHSTAPLHTNSLVLPALLAAAESDSASPSHSGLDFLRAYIVGCEVGPRVGLALRGADLLTRGWHSGALQGPSATAAAVSNFLHLSPQQTEWALGTACTQAGGLMSAQFGSMAKRMQHGFAARNGLTATLLARQDYTGIEEVYEQSYGGFLSCFGQGASVEPKTFPDELVKELGTTWQIEGIRVKLHASMAALHGPIDCMVALQKEHPKLFEREKLNDISEIETRHSAAAFNHGGWIAPRDKPLSSTGAQMSIQYAVATQLLDGEVWVEQFGSDKLNQPERRELMTKVKPILEKAFDEDKGQTWRTKATVVFGDGTKVETVINAPKGIEPPASNDDIQQKWRKLAGTVIEESEMERIENMILGLEELDDVRKLAKLLSGIRIAKSPIT